MKLATSYFGCRIVRHVRRDMQRLQRLGFRRVIHTFSENDLTYSRGTMKQIVEVSREAGLEVLLDPWGVAGVFGGEAFSRWIIEDPDLVQRGPSGRPLGGACLNHPRLVQRMREWIDAAAECHPDGLFWDEPHWAPEGPSNPDGEACVCEHCRKRGNRAGAVVRLLRRLSAYADRRGLWSSVCVLPRDTLDQPPLDWKRIARIPEVREFGTDPYWQAFGIRGPKARNAFVDDNATAALAAARAGNAECMLWVQAFRVPAAGEDDLLEGARRLAAHRPETIAIWGFEACAHMSELACARPERVWRRLVSALRKAAGRP